MVALNADMRSSMFEKYGILLDGKNNPLCFAFGPGVIRLGVQEPDAQARTDDASVIIGEGAALVGVEFGGQTAALEGFFESLVKGLRVAGAFDHFAFGIHCGFVQFESAGRVHDAIVFAVADEHGTLDSVGAAFESVVG